MTTRSLTVSVWAILIASALRPAEAQWSAAQPLSPADGDIVDLAASKNGGFHACYRSPNRVNYRRYNGSLGPVVGAFTSGFNSGACVAEALNGDVHIVFENWVGAVHPQVGWCKSTNSGASFTPVVNISNTSPGCAKFPFITPYGTSASPTMLMSYFRSGSTGGCNKDFYYSVYNGSSWTTESATGFKSHSEYDCWGQGWSPLDGTVYRTFDPNDYTMKMRRYAGSWSSDITMSADSWPVRQHIAINGAGQVMVVYDTNSTIYSQLYTPNNGPGPVIAIATGGYSGSCDVAWIPGTNQFYLVIGKAGGAFRVTGYKWAGGRWGPVETVMNGLADEFLAYPSVAVSPVTGQVYCAWQYHWPDSFAQVFYSVRSAFPVPTSGTLTGTVTNQAGQPQVGVVVDALGAESAVTDIAGRYSMPVPVGTYTVKASKNFVGGATVNGVAITANNTTTLNMVISTIPPDPVTSFAVLSSPNTVNELMWTNPTSGQFAGTLVRYRTDGTYPTGPTDGQVAGDFADAPGSTRTFSHTGLTNGVTYYYAAFAHDNNASATYSNGAYAQGTPALKVDFDADGDVDQSDFGRFQLCLTGESAPQYEPTCANARLDNDLDVDGGDVQRFIGCFSGPGNYATPTCLPVP